MIYLFMHMFSNKIQFDGLSKNVVITVCEEYLFWCFKFLVLPIPDDG